MFDSAGTQLSVVEATGQSSPALLRLSFMGVEDSAVPSALL